MNCDDFLARMHECIDDRLPFDEDRQFRDHADVCPSCRMQWNAWQQIASLVSASGDSDSEEDLPGVTAGKSVKRTKWRRLSVSAVAALILVTVVARRHDVGIPGPSNAVMTDRAAGIDAAEVTPINPPARVTGSPLGDKSVEPGVDAAQWWQEVQDRDWLAQTMPTVRSLRDGVVPLGRSIMQAVSILTVGGGERTS